MDLKDFEGCTVLRYMIPFTQIVCGLILFMGPFYFPQVFQYICFGALTVTAIKAVLQMSLNLIVLVKANRVLQRVASGQKRTYSQVSQVGQQVYHAFIIPSYKQDIQLIAQTLTVLSKHFKSASSYLVFLAMQKHEEGSDLKAQQLIKRFQSKFRHISYSRHEVRQFEAKGKASNVCWCAQKMGYKFKQLMISEDDIFVTVMDADSWAPEVYFNQIQDHIKLNHDQRFNFVFQPPQIYARNNFDVPFITRTYDDMYSSMHASNLVTCTSISTPLSNYTLSYNLIKKVGFWDTVQEAIGEDFHMFVKSIFKTNAQAKAVTIYAAWNQLSIQTGEGFCQDVKAKFWQIQRHARVVSDLRYMVIMLFRTSFSFKKILMVFIFYEMIFGAIILPWFATYIIIQESIAFSPFAQHFGLQATLHGIMSTFNTVILINIASISSALGLLFYQFFKRKSAKVLYGVQSKSIIRALEGPLMYTPNVIGLISTSYLVASFGNLKGNREYVVADKKVTRVEVEAQRLITAENS